MLKQITFSILTIGFLATAVPALGDCSHSKKLAISPISSDGINRVRIDAAAGSLQVVGGATSVIRAGGEACASSASRLDGIRLLSERRGDQIEIRVEIDSARGLFFRNTHASLDLEVELPQGMSVEIDDGSGSIDVRGVGSLDIEDGSGSITVRNCGPTRIDDGSGSIDVADIQGDLWIEDGSGEIDVRDISGTVRIDDGSGSVDITRVGGDVIIVDDGSGSIRITDVRGDLRVGDHGSGGLSFDRIDGRVSVRD